MTVTVESADLVRALVVLLLAVLLVCYGYAWGQVEAREADDEAKEKGVRP